MSNTIDELPTGAGGEIDGHRIRITDELPVFIGLPMKAILIVMQGIVIFSGFLMAFTFGAVVVIRYGFGGDLFAYEEWLLAISIVGFFAGAVLASERQLHISADILGMMIENPRLIWWRTFVVLAVEVFVTLFLVYACYVSLLDDFSFPRLRATTVLRIPFVSWRIAIMVAFGLMAMFTAAYMYVHIRRGLGYPLKSETAKGAAQ
ncbi:TRAP-type C4-dicarboxylate transport system, small permease component [Sulfitobacter noctilucae]|uniref:TRAP transporter small permease n=1 Tax=Sulfitobacter noctilucae TaxID=1342302 RepID=UPI0004686A29|nr:TRAP transporter small permease subunit [Sulfitobacter noctilucae]KIN60656.1 TRAP-type C4-dicarboxylate transport system, small permease component [Sulfitobacter noctilucae]